MESERATDPWRSGFSESEEGTDGGTGVGFRILGVQGLGSVGFIIRI